MNTILVVDDSKTYLTLAKQTLEDLYHVMPVLSGAQALRFLEKKRPDLILLDINMPEMDGRETMRRLRENPACADIPVIFLTASTEPETEVECLELGASDFITKPFVPQVMRVRIARTLELETYRRAAEQKAKRFENIASTDGLTGLWNRACLTEHINQHLQNGGTLAYLIIDVDHFKSVNDKLGHIMGDTVLKQLADTLRASFPDQMVGRIGGDEFVVAIPNPPTEATLMAQIRNFQTVMNAGFAETTNGIASTSIGISLAPQDATTYQGLYDCADKALYLVKNGGKNSFRFFASAPTEGKATVAVSQGIQTDMQLLHQQLCEQGSVRGAYWQEYAPFLAIYRFMVRNLDRQQSVFSLLLLTLRTEDGTTPAPDILTQCMELLHNSIQIAIRKDDVFTTYSSAQYLTLLPNATEELVANVILPRILQHFHSACETKSITVTHEISFFHCNELSDYNVIHT